MSRLPKVPDDFLWGVATSAYQSEGGYNGPGQPRTNWADAEERGKVMKTGAAVDFRTRFREDFERCREMGLKAFRLGIEWSRVELARGEFDEAALDQYVEMLAACRAHGLEPVVTLHHFVHPAWLGADAWLEEGTPELFARYVGRAVTHVNAGLAARGLAPIHFYITVNEPNMLVLNTYVGTQFPSRAKTGYRSVLRAFDSLLTAHVLAYEAIHSIYECEGWPTPQATQNNYCSDVYWADKVLLDLLAVRENGVERGQVRAHVIAKAREFEAALQAARLPLHRDLAYWIGTLFKLVMNRVGYRWFTGKPLRRALDAIYASRRPRLFDYVGLDYYDPFAAHVFRWPVLSDHEFTDRAVKSRIMNTVTSKWWDWRVLPRGLHFFCAYYSMDLGGRDVLIAENGMAIRRKPDNRHTTRRDRLTRSQFLRLHVHEVQKIVGDGIPLIGYLHWSLFDNYEWGSYTPRFGLFAIDYARGSERLVEDALGDRPSETYAELIREARP